MTNQVHCFCFNEEDNGGESLTLTTRANFDKGEDLVFYTQELTLMSYGNSASFNLGDFHFNPFMLRKLADELESFMEQFENSPKKRIEELKEELKRLEAEIQ